MCVSVILLYYILMILHHIAVSHCAPSDASNFDAIHYSSGWFCTIIALINVSYCGVPSSHDRPQLARLPGSGWNTSSRIYLAAIVFSFYSIRANSS